MAEIMPSVKNQDKGTLVELMESLMNETKVEIVSSSSFERQNGQ